MNVPRFVLLAAVVMLLILAACLTAVILGQAVLVRDLERQVSTLAKQRASWEALAKRFEQLNYDCAKLSLRHD